jgi:hypothetical protein
VRAALLVFFKFSFASFTGFGNRREHEHLSDGSINRALAMFQGAVLCSYGFRLELARVGSCAGDGARAKLSEDKQKAVNLEPLAAISAFDL